MTEHADALIIGAGASGGVAALRLARAGVRVVCLEQGTWSHRDDYPGAGIDAELLQRKTWASSPNLRARPADYPIDLTASDMQLGNFNGVGGGTVLYSAVWPRLLPSDFSARSRAGVADDWPLTYAELSPFYEETDRQFGVSGLGGNPVYPEGADPPLPPLPIGAAGLTLARAHARLGWHWWPEYNAILSAERDGRHACVQRGTCTTGCNEGAKGSTDVTHWPPAIAAGARLVTGARVRRLEVDGRGRVRGAVWIDADGAEHFQGADIVLCAANGIGTPRLLLCSDHAGAPDGLANSSGLVGRRLMVHPGALVDGYFDDDLRSWRGHFGGQIQCLEFGGQAPTRGFPGGAKWSLTPTGGPLDVAFGVRGKPVLGPQHHRDFRARFGRGARWVILCEDLPDPENRIELSSTLTDASGMPAPAVTYRLSADVRRAVAWNVERAIESLTEAGAHTTAWVEMRQNSHLLGTARMGDDRRASVVDRWGRAHDVGNLLVIDGSVFVTAGAANPTSTLCALALRAVDHLLAHRGEVPIPEPAHHTSFATPMRPVAREGTAEARCWSDDERDRLRALARELVPAAHGMPGADEVGVADHQLDAVIAVRPDLADALQRALRDRPDDAATAVEQLRVDDRAAYRALVLVTLAGYYRAPDVRRRIGYPGSVPVPVGRFTYDEYVDEGLLDHLFEEHP